MYLVCFISFDPESIFRYFTMTYLNYCLEIVQWWMSLIVKKSSILLFVFLYQIRGFSRLLTLNAFIISDTCSYCSGMDYHLRCPHSLVVALHTNDHTSRLCFGEAALCLVAQGHLEPLIQWSTDISSTYFVMSAVYDHCYHCSMMVYEHCVSPFLFHFFTVL